MLKKTPSDKLNGTKKFLFLWAPTHHSFTFNLQFLFFIWAEAEGLSVSKSYVRFSIFDSVLFLVRFIFLFNKMVGPFDFKNVIIPFKIKTIEKPQTVLLPDVWFLICVKKFKNSVISSSVKASQKLT